MKRFGATLDFQRQRTDALLKGYRMLAAAVSRIEIKDIAAKLINLPAPRFWVSDKRAFDVVSAMCRGIPVLDSMRPTKREMFIEIHRRALEIVAKNPETSLHDAVTDVVHGPAPKHYLTPKTAYEYVLQAHRAARSSRHPSSGS